MKLDIALFSGVFWTRKRCFGNFESKLYRYIDLCIQDFHMNYVLVPADKAANKVVVV